MVLFILFVFAILYGFICLAAYLFLKITDHLSHKDWEKKKAEKEAEDKKKYPGSKPWI